MTPARLAIQRAAALLRSRTNLSQGSLFGESSGIGGQGRLFSPHADAKGGTAAPAVIGHWVTIHGLHILIGHGESVGEALKKKFSGTDKQIDHSHVAGAGRQIKLQGGRPHIEPHHLRPETWTKQSEADKPTAEPAKPAATAGTRVIETVEARPSNKTETPGGVRRVHENLDDALDHMTVGLPNRSALKGAMRKSLLAGKPQHLAHGTFHLEGTAGAPKVPDAPAAVPPTAAAPAVTPPPPSPSAPVAAPAAAPQFKPDDHVSVSGNTFPHRTALAKAGFAFDKASKTWTGPHGNLPGGLAGTKIAAASESTQASLANADHVGKAFEYGHKRLGESKITGWNLFKDYGGDTQLIEGIKNAGGTVNAEGHASITRDGHTLTVKPSVGPFPGRASLMRNDEPAPAATTGRNAGVVDPNRQLGMFAKDSNGNAVEVGEKIGQGSLFGSTVKPPAAPPAVKNDDQKLRDKFDEKATPSMFSGEQSKHTTAPSPTPKHVLTKDEALASIKDSLKEYETGYRAYRARHYPEELGQHVAIAYGVDEVASQVRQWVKDGGHAYAAAVLKDSVAYDLEKWAKAALPKAEAKPVEPEQPYHLTKGEYYQKTLPNQADRTAQSWRKALADHREHVANAVASGKTVPKHVIEDYPDLIPKTNLSAVCAAAIAAGRRATSADAQLKTADGDAMYLSANAAGVQYLSAACSIRDAVTVGQGLPKKINGLDVHYRWCDAAYAGDWAHPKTGRAVPITPKRIDDWVGKIKLSRSRGVNLPVCKDHQETADSSVGEIFDARRTGNRLDLLLGFKGDDALRIGQRNYLSIGIDGNFKDSRKNAYGEAIRHVAVTPVPVIHGQTGFLPE